MRVWKVEVWIMWKDDSPWENIQDEYVLTESIDEAIREARNKQRREFKPFALEVRAVSIECDITVIIPKLHTDEKEE